MKHASAFFATTVLFFGVIASTRAQKLSQFSAGLFNEKPIVKKKTPTVIRESGKLLSNGTVQALIEYKGELYATGSFQMAGNTKASNIARWNGSEWSPVGAGLDYAGSAFCVYNDELYVAGSFKKAGGIPAKHIAKWDGINWSSIGEPGTDDIQALVVYKDALYVGGNYAAEENIQANVFKWDGKKWSALKTKYNNDVFALAVYKNKLYAGGTFLPNANAHVMQWNGKKWTDAGVQLNGAVSCFTVHDKKLYTGGYFGQLNNKPAPFVVSFDGRKWNYTSKGLGGTIPYHWMSTLMGFGNNLYAGGNFTTGEEGKPAKNLSVLNADGWGPVVYNMEGSVYTMA
ncbi:MAG TPA: hypothetical protein VM187_00725, partial [Niastella sp.]|nr:hypothetical protein [Niastella sp.]